MSTTEHHDAMLSGYLGPFFPESVRKLREQLDRLEGVNGYTLGIIATRLHGEASRDHNVTVDGYFWFWGIEFNNSDVVILIPWSQDWGKTGGTQADRSIALHVRSGSPATGDAIVERLTRLLEEEIDRLIAAEAARSKAKLN